MKDIYKMTKEELIAKCKRLQSENERLQDELDSLSDCYSELENQYAEQIDIMDSDECIKDVKWFKLKLDLEGLLTPELESFIEYYLKYHNEMG
jgi:predicted nuclease with TOPRIM domain